MPVFKYKSFEEAREALWKIKPDTNLKSLSILWDIALFLNPHTKCQRGVFKFKSLEKAQRHRKKTIG